VKGNSRVSSRKYCTTTS